MRYHEVDEIRHAPARVPAIRCDDENATGGAARRVPEAPSRVQGEARNAWPEAQGQATPRFPRPCRLINRFRFRRQLFAGEFLPCEPFAHNLTNGQIEAVTIVHVFAVVVAESLFVKIAEQVERPHDDVSACRPSCWCERCRTRRRG